MKKTLLLFSVIVLFQSCKIYDSKPSSVEESVLYGGKVRVKSSSNVAYKFDKLIMEENNLYGIGKKNKNKSKAEFNKNIINENADDNYVKILLTEELANEIHLHNKGKSTAVLGLGIGLGVLYIATGLAVLILIAAL